MKNLTINVGDYVRTKYGIAKTIDLKENPYGEKTIYVLDKKIIDVYECEGGELALCNPLIETMQDKFDTKFGDEKLVIKSSPNIIDLIEVGDYVNGCYVTNRQASHNEGITIISKRIGIIKCNAYFNQSNYDYCEFKWLEEKDIKSIVTKEQFESMEYKIERL